MLAVLRAGQSGSEAKFQLHEAFDLRLMLKREQEPESHQQVFIALNPVFFDCSLGEPLAFRPLALHAPRDSSVPSAKTRLSLAQPHKCFVVQPFALVQFHYNPSGRSALVACTRSVLDAIRSRYMMTKNLA